MKKEYQQLMKKRPEYFQNSEEPGSIFIYTDLDKIAEVEQKCHTSVGIMYQDQYIYLLKDAVRHPNGKDGTYIRILYATEGVGVVMLPILLPTMEILLLSHYRHASRKTYLELPRGFAEEGLTEEENVRKEVLEETGYQITRMEYLGNLAGDTGMTGGEIKAYAVYLGGQKGTQDEKESVCGIRMVHVSEIQGMIRRGEITEGYTLSVFALAQAIGII